MSMLLETHEGVIGDRPQASHEEVIGDGVAEV